MNNSALHLISAPFPLPIGGVSASAVNLRDMLELNGQTVRCFSTSSGAPNEDLYARKSLRHALRGASLLFRFFGFLARSRAYPQIHLFCVSNSAFLRDFLFLLLAKVFNKHVIVHLHSKTSGELFLSARLFGLFGRMLSVADKVIVLSAFHRDFFSKVIAPDKLLVMENFVFGAHFSGGNHQRHFLFVGRLSLKKGFYDLIEAVGKLVHAGSHHELVVDCLGEAENAEEFVKLKGRILSLGLQKHILLHGSIAGEAKFEYFKNARCLLFPSHFENSPVVLKEAIAARMPVIASDLDANRRVLNASGAALYFQTGDASALAAAITSFLDDAAVSQRLNEAAQSAFVHDDAYAYACIATVFK